MIAEEKICIGNQNVNDAEYPVVREGVFSEDDAARKKKRKLGKNKLNVDVSDESQFIDCNKSEMGLDDNHLESSNSAQPPSEGSDASGSKKSSSIVNFGRKKETIPQVTNDNKPDSNFGGAGSMAEPKKRKRERIKTTPPPDHIHITDATKSDPGLMENVLLTCPGQNFHDADTKKRKKNKCGRKKEYIQGEVSFMDKENLDSEPVKNVLETGLGSKLPEIENVHSLDNSSEKTIKIRRKRKRRRKKVVAAIEEQVVDTKAPDAFPNPTVQFQCERACMISDLSEKMLNENMVIKAKKRRKKKKAKSFPAEGTVDISTEDAESLENLAYENAANNGKRKRNSKKIIVDGHVQGQKKWRSC